MSSFLIFGALFYEIQDIIDRLFGIVSGDSTLDICEEFAIMFNGLTVSAGSVAAAMSTYLVVFAQLKL
jgi:hypothetical protein